MVVPVATYRPNKQVQVQITKYIRACSTLMRQQWNLREEMLDVDRKYMREVDATIEQAKAYSANRRGDPTKFQNITVPVVMPQVENAVTYQTSVFCDGYPMFGVVADPSNIDAAQMMDTIIGEQQIRGGWTQEFQKGFRNGFKYNLIAEETSWEPEVTFTLENSTNSTEAAPKETIWAGNVIRTLDLYNTIFDPRVKPNEIAKEGEFAGYIKMYGHVALVRYLQSLPNSFNHDDALSCAGRAPISYGPDQPDVYFMPELNPRALLKPDSLMGTNWAIWANLSDAGNGKFRGYYHGMYQVTTLYARIIPKYMGMSGPAIIGPNIPQIWKFILVNNQVLVSAERLSNVHQLLPIQFAQSYDDGLGYQTKSLAVNVGPIQEITSALSNSSISARRRAVADRMLYDSSRISAGAINNDNPISKIPVKPSAFGGSLADAVYPVPFNDALFQVNTAETQGFLAMANMITGMNPARQGQFVKGNKTRAEFQEVMGNANGRDQTVALSLEASLMTPIKEILKANILQYQGGVELYNREQGTPVQVDPLKLRKAMLVFKMSDGLLPNQKLLDSDALTVAFQTIQAVPAVSASFNIGPMVSYLMKSAGAKISPFEKRPEQIAYEQAVQQWQQTIMSAAQALSTNKEITSEMLQGLQSQLPPMPTPEQFGYDPKSQVTQAGGTGAKSILDQVVLSSAQESGSPGDIAGNS